MKTISTLFVLIFFTIQSALCGGTPTVLQQLENLNEFWKNKDLDYPILWEKIRLKDDVSLIQMHLTLVEKTLRGKNVSYLTPEQKLNRGKCLDILKSYSAKGIFPKNLYHTKRTPYFIDKFGTACAVGELIIKTGYGNLASEISAENNNGYIQELNIKYAEISQWANLYGFTTDELAWIQPCYCPIGGPAAIVNVSCNGGWDGYFMPEVTGGTPPYNYYAWYILDNGVWQLVMCGGCDLTAGYYKCSVVDAASDTLDFFATITEPPAISATITHNDVNGNCNGSASAQVAGGTPGYTYSWSPGGYTTATINNVCAGTYTVSVVDFNNCVFTDMVTINDVTGINENEKSGISIFPNPASDNLQITLGEFYKNDKTTAVFYNSVGQEIFRLEIENANYIVDLRNFEKGVYSVSFDNGMNAEMVPFVVAK